MLLICVVAGVDDQRVVHHGSTAFGHTFQCFHDPHQHTTVVLANLDPDWIVGLLHVPKVVALLLNAQSLPGTKNLTSTGAYGQCVGNTRRECRDAQVQQTIMPVGFELRLGVPLVDFRSELPQVIGDRVEPIAQSVDIFESLDVLLVSLPISRWKRLSLCGRQLFNLVHDIRSSFVLEPNVAGRNASIQHLIEMIWI